MNLQPSAKRLESVFTAAGFDGCWSHLTELLLIVHSCQPESLCLDRNWAFTKQSFTCPLCQQNKLALAEKSGETLDLILHCDHDHISDYLARQAKEQGVQCDLRPLVSKYSSYKPTIICRACNWIDSQVKHRCPEIPKDFSFPLVSKASMIRKAGKKRHKICRDLAWSEWLEKKSEYEQKCLNISRDLFDLRGSAGELIGSKFKKTIYDAAYRRFCKVCDRACWSLSFDDFLKASMAWSR